MDSEGKKSRMTTSGKNPFTMPKYISQYRVLEEEGARQEQRRKHALKVHQKGIQPRESSRKILLHYMKQSEEQEQKEMLERMFADEVVASRPKTHEPPKWGYYHMGTLQDFTEKQREISRLKYCIAMREQKIQDLKDQALRAEKEMAKAEGRCTDEAFLNHVDKEVEKTALALNRAEEVKTAVLAQEEEIQRTEREIKKVKKDITKYKKMLELEKQCEEFLFKLLPPEWQKQQEARRQTAEKIKASAMEKEPDAQANQRHRSGNGTVLPPIQNSPSKISVESYKPKKMQKEDEGIVGNLEVYEKPQMYFTDPNQLLEIIKETEDETQCLFEELDSIERSLEFYRECERKVHKDMEMKKAQLTDEIESLMRSISENRQRAEELEENVRLFKSSEGSLQTKNADLKRLNEKIEEVHRVCLGRAPDTSDSCEMLKVIELYMHELLEKFESLPQEQLIQIKRQYKRERIARSKKEEKLQKAMALEEKRRQRAALRQQEDMAEVQKPAVKREVNRSWLVKTVHPGDDKNVALSREEQELEKYLLE